MKYLLPIFLFTTFLVSVTNAQTVTGPGLENDEPPTAAVDRQEDTLGESTALKRESRKTPEKKYNPLNEKGPHGKQAQEEAKSRNMKMDKKEIKRKQKGE